MFALCVESSHTRGMGHFFRAFNLANALKRAGHTAKLFINADAPSIQWLERCAMPYTTVDLSDVRSDWEGPLIAREGVRVWINDRLNTSARHADHVTRSGVPLVTFDDRGDGAAMADLNIAALTFDASESLPGRRVLRGAEYLILNPDIARHRRIRHQVDRVVVTFGGTDTHGVTLKAIECLRVCGRKATVIVGPGFSHDSELAAVVGGLAVKRSVPSLVEEFANHDLAITGGGITPFEANASGLPCIVIASEPFEVPVAQELARRGGSVFAGYHTEIDISVFERPLPIQNMSAAGLRNIRFDGTERIVAELVSLAA